MATRPLVTQAEQGTCLSHLCFSLHRGSGPHPHRHRERETCRRHSAHERALVEFARTGAGISEDEFFARRTAEAQAYSIAHNCQRPHIRSHWLCAALSRRRRKCAGHPDG
jgi:hypothetical protein